MSFVLSVVKIAYFSDNAATPSGTPQRNNACAAAAQQRAQDAGYNGYDRDMQKRIYDYTYTDCAARERNLRH